MPHAVHGRNEIETASNYWFHFTDTETAIL